MPEVERLPESDYQNVDGDFLFYRDRLMTRGEAIGLLEQLARLREQRVKWNQGEPSLGQPAGDWIDDEERELLDLLGF